MFDLLINSEVIVDDVARTESVFVESLGFPQQRPRWSSTEAGKGFTFLFARVHPSLKVSPTRIEAMAVAPVYDSVDPAHTITFLPALLSAQGRRPWKTHANELATSDIQGVAERLQQNGCRFFTMPATQSNPYTRLWVGWTDQHPGEYKPDVDGGLMLEICETDALGQGPGIWDSIPPLDLPPGSMVRVLRRSWIVEDLDATLALLDRNLDWRPEASPVVDERVGCRRAVLGFAHPRSADVELLEAVAPGEVKASFDAWGPGAWTIRIGVNDLKAKAADFERRHTPFSVLEPDGSDTVLRVDTGSLGVPGLFEFVEIPVT